MAINGEIEYCNICDDIYATYPILWMMFNSHEGETFNSREGTFECPRCQSKITRYEGFIEALRKRESPIFVDSLLSSIDDLTPESIDLLRVALANFTVPSFSIKVKSASDSILSELLAKRYLEKTVGMGNTILTLNANKLCLLDNYELLIKLYHQQSFINNPDYLVRKDYECSRRRRSRLLALVNDFTGDDREEVLQKFEGKCAFTGKDVPLHFDHIIPLAVGHGGTTKANMLPIWQRINSSKNARNLFEWYEDNGDRFEVKPELFNKAVEYIAGLNGMTFAEYREYVYDCHANPNDNLTEVR